VRHKGQIQTFTSALPTLLKLARNPQKFAGVLGCKLLPPMHAVPPQAREIPDLDWSHCPLDLLGAPHFAAIIQLDRLATVAPLSGWPDRYTAWVVGGLIALRAAREA